MSTKAACMPGRTSLTLPRYTLPDHAALRALDVEFDELPVLEQGDPGLVDVMRDQHLAGDVGHCSLPSHGRDQTSSSLSTRRVGRVRARRRMAMPARRAAARDEHFGRRDPCGPMRTVRSTTTPLVAARLHPRSFGSAARQIENLLSCPCARPSSCPPRSRRECRLASLPGRTPSRSTRLIEP